jgi:glucose-1-phosphate cytidylyltransferase
MKVLILAAGEGFPPGALVAEPPPLVEIGGIPVIMHMLTYYSHYNLNEFVLAIGEGYKEVGAWFLDREPLGKVISGGETILEPTNPGWTLNLINSSSRSSGSVVKELTRSLCQDTFLLTSVNFLSDVNLGHMVRYHRSHGKTGTLTSVRPPSRFGHLKLHGNAVVSFEEKPRIRDQWINGGLYILNPGVADYIEEGERLEREPLERLIDDGQLMAYQHEHFWHRITTSHDRELLEELWQSGSAPWIAW